MTRAFDYQQQQWTAELGALTGGIGAQPPIIGTRRGVWFRSSDREIYAHVHPTRTLTDDELRGVLDRAIQREAARA